MPENQDSTYKLYKVHDIQKVKNGFVIILLDEDKGHYFDVASISSRISFKRKIHKGRSYKFLEVST